MSGHCIFSLRDGGSESHGILAGTVVIAGTVVTAGAAFAAGTSVAADKVEGHLIDPSKYSSIPFDMTTVQMSLCHEDQFMPLNLSVSEKVVTYWYVRVYCAWGPLT